MATGFVKAKCAKCRNEQMIFSKPSTEVKCLVCGEVLARPMGGKGFVIAAPNGEEPEKAAKTAVEKKTKADAVSES